ncbi:hypothetical protein [Halobacillus kuroshimensis]|uniref:hypothetical protein n=1 Tax=Halobacillus kuroshimensis TaxID=302481 RepID=UPI00041219A5|nr:hypothetical protein [Halobacillus kuroshimensis]
MTQSTATKTLREQWEEHYLDGLNDIFQASSLSQESKIEGIKFLNYVDRSMKNMVLKEFENISKTFQECDLIEILLTGLDNLFGRAQYQPQTSVHGHREGIFLAIDDYSQIEFDPFVLENEMLTEYTVSMGNWHLSLHLYENDPCKLQFSEFESAES